MYICVHIKYNAYTRAQRRKNQYSNDASNFKFPCFLLKNTRTTSVAVYNRASCSRDRKRVFEAMYSFSCYVYVIKFLYFRSIDRPRARKLELCSLASCNLIYAHTMKWTRACSYAKKMLLTTKEQENSLEELNLEI
uniref:Uncharacterized protein n=1 Tax=Trichogramma kaykai TaxID=54128 RepID=A0ABD2XNN0_9HYME